MHKRIYNGLFLSPDGPTLSLPDHLTPACLDICLRFVCLQITMPTSVLTCEQRTDQLVLKIKDISSKPSASGPIAVPRRSKSPSTRLAPTHRSWRSPSPPTTKPWHSPPLAFDKPYRSPPPSPPGPTKNLRPTVPVPPVIDIPGSCGTRFSPLHSPKFKPSVVIPVCIPPTANGRYEGRSRVLDHAVIPWDLLDVGMLEPTQQTQLFSVSKPVVQFYPDQASNFSRVHYETQMASAGRTSKSESQQIISPL